VHKSNSRRSETPKKHLVPLVRQNLAISKMNTPEEQFLGNILLLLTLQMGKTSTLTPVHLYSLDFSDGPLGFRALECLPPA
jgi:hypothetical protein